MCVERIKSLRRGTQKEYTQGTSSQPNRCKFYLEGLREAYYRTSVKQSLLIIISIY